MLGLDAANRICALPLERTNVRIECEQNGLYTIDGWTVTDEEGNRYIYRQKEWSADIVKEEAVSFNGLRDKSYVSSWYLSRIEPVNGSPLVYHYFSRMSGKAATGRYPAQPLLRLYDPLCLWPETAGTYFRLRTLPGRF